MVISSVSSISQKSLASEMVRDEWDTRLVDEGPIKERRLSRVSDAAAVPFIHHTTASEKDAERGEEKRRARIGNEITMTQSFQHTQRKKRDIRNRWKKRRQSHKNENHAASFGAGIEGKTCKCWIHQSGFHPTQLKLKIVHQWENTTPKIGRKNKLSLPEG